MPTRNINNDLKVNANLYLNMDTNSLSGDSNGAVVLAGYDSLTLKTQSSPRVTINSSGNVGIGTTSPDAKLVSAGIVDGDFTALRLMNQKTYGSGTGTNEKVRFVMGISENGTPFSSREGFAIDVGVNHESDSSNAIVNFGVRDGGTLGTYQTVNGHNKSVDFVGNVDIGSVFTFNTSTDLFQITNNQNTGGINLSGGNSRIYFGGYRAIEGDQSGGTLYIGEGYGAISLMDDVAVSGGVTVSGALNINVGSSIHGTITSSSNSLTLNARNTGIMLFQSGGSEKMRIASSGNVGIGSTSPSRLLTLENNSSTVSNNSQLRINNIGAGDAYIYLFAGSDWSLGIDNSDSDKFKLCTTNDVSDGTEVVTVDRSGNVGIGTTSPNVRTEIAASVNGNPVTSGTTQTYGALRVRGSATNVLDIGQQSASPYGMWMQVCDSTSLGTEYPLLLNPNGGNVGIGIASPAYKLHVAGTVGFTNQLYFTNNTAYIQLGSSWGNGVLNFLNGSTTAITFDVPNNRIKNNLGKYLTSSSGTGQFGTLDNQAVAIVANNSTKMTILSGGNVGIGTTSPRNKLDVTPSNGSFRISDYGGAYFGNSSDTGHELYLHGRSNGALSIGRVAVANLTGGTGGYAATTYDHIHITSAGNVGIGITDPDTELEVGGTIKASTHTDAIVIGSPTTVKWKMGVYGGNDLLIRDASNNTKFSILSGGNVGIGHTTLYQKFTVNGNIDIRGGDGCLLTFNNGDGGIGVHFNNTGTVGRDIAFKTYEAGVGNTEKMRITKNGNVGIGTTSPAAKLQVYSTATRDIFISGHGTQAQNDWTGEHAFFISAGQGVIIGKANANNNTNRLHILYNDSSGNANYLAYNTSNTAKIHLNTNGNSYLNGGNVGIGTNSPSQKLDVNGTAIFGAAATRLTTYSDSGYAGIYNGSSLGAEESIYMGGGGIFFIANSAERMRINSSGYVGIGTSNPSSKLVVADGMDGGNSQTALEFIPQDNNNRNIIFSYDRSSSTYKQIDFSASDFQFTADGQYPRMVIENGGNVGIGETAPEVKLEVAGDIQAKDSGVLAGANGAKDGFIFHDLYTSAGNYYGYKGFTSPTRLSIVTNGIEGLTIDANSNVGIGVGGTNPDARLRLKGAGGSSGLTFKTTDFSNNETFYVFDGGRAGVRYSPFSIGIPSTTSVATNAVFQVEEAGLLTVLSTGKVGIGTTSPAKTLDITGEIRTSGRATFNEYVNTSLVFGTTDLNLGYAGGTSGIFIKGSTALAGNVGIGTTSPSVGLQLGNSTSGQTKLAIFNSEGGSEVGLTIQSRTNRAKLRVADNDSNAYVVAEAGKAFFGTSSNGDANNITVLTGGNVGIGTTSPTEKLHVEGNIELINGGYIGSLDGSYWQRIRFEDATPSTTNAFNFETRNGSGSFIKHVVIRNDGNVGVGNATPATKLAVEGTIAHKVYTVSTLPSASPAGQRAFVSDSSYSVSAAHGLVTVGSGSNFCPMYSDGTNWRVG